MISPALSPAGAAFLFAGWEETMIWSCLQGVMGEIYVNHSHAPTAAAAFPRDFLFLAGTPDPELAAFWPPACQVEELILVPQTEDWATLIENCYGSRAKRVTRYAFHKDPSGFDRAKLAAAAARLPAGYTLHLIDQPLYHQCLSGTPQSRDWVCQFDSFAQFQQYGIGVVCLKGGEIVAGAASYTCYQGGIEVQIDTLPAHRRQGLALACGAQLILECLQRGLYPSWDAQNPWSAALAAKLGYRFSHEYPAYEVTRNPIHE